MSEDLVFKQARSLGRFGYLTLGSTTLAQLRRSRYIKSNLTAEEEKRKPDAIIFLPLGGIKAVIEFKQPKELAGKKLAKVVETYAPIARAVCKLLIVSDGARTFWYNAFTEEPVLDEDGKPVTFPLNATALDAQTVSDEDRKELIRLVEKADNSLSEDTNQFEPLRIIDPSALARSVWQLIWINTGKEPEKCLYNVVEILVFKFLSDIDVLTGNYSFKRIVELLSSEGDVVALNHYAKITRDKIRSLFPKGEDGTTIINGTIFVNEAGLPNPAQAGLFGQVIRAFQQFDDENGSLQYIDRQFKTRLYESFLRQQAGIRSLGQYFTPRNVVQAIVRMSSASTLKPGDSICDPFCGVGGFLLEAIAENQNLMNQFRPKNGKVSPAVLIRGYDKGTDEKDDERTIILAKANMLVYFSDLLSTYHTENDLKQYAKAFNDVFHLIRSNLGTFERIDADERYDLILTNPPYVTSGSASIKSAIEADDGLRDSYTAGGRGTESLALQWVVNHLKPGGEAYVVVPDGLMNQSAILQYIRERCEVLAIIALPSRTFYSTPKKTYILALRAKDEGAGATSQDRVFTYLISEIGESRDTRRVPVNTNDLSSMEHEFRFFRADAQEYESTDPRCKILDAKEFAVARHWMIDRNWTHDEKVELGIVDETFEVDPEAFKALLSDARNAIDDLFTELG